MAQFTVNAEVGSGSKYAGWVRTYLVVAADNVPAALERALATWKERGLRARFTLVTPGPDQLLSRDPEMKKRPCEHAGSFGLLPEMVPHEVPVCLGCGTRKDRIV